MDVVNAVEAQETQGWAPLIDSKRSGQSSGGAAVTRKTGT